MILLLRMDLLPVHDINNSKDARLCRSAQMPEQLVQDAHWTTTIERGRGENGDKKLKLSGLSVLSLYDILRTSKSCRCRYYCEQQEKERPSALLQPSD